LTISVVSVGVAGCNGTRRLEKEDASTQGVLVISTIATDLPGRFPPTSGQGHSYAMMMYDFDSNTINAVAIMNRKKESLIKGYNDMYEDLQKTGINPVLHQLDNETSKDLTKEIEKEGLKHQIASPRDHRLNRAERTIQTFRNHFIAILYGTDSGFPAKQ
jgi:hypothetical protein